MRKWRQFLWRQSCASCFPLLTHPRHQTCLYRVTSFLEVTSLIWEQCFVKLLPRMLTSLCCCNSSHQHLKNCTNSLPVKQKMPHVKVTDMPPAPQSLIAQKAAEPAVTTGWCCYTWTTWGPSRNTSSWLGSGWLSCPSVVVWCFVNASFSYCFKGPVLP